ncbi:DUF4252 domain-containing protein [Catalinimonas niigatensis]|uniref:DUF4252 domain-containing protein n=1 Tax=Catalinimonas niigatensis TaxID=1397264 RepID=UPI0026659212|nr:DUF4252 domain-containing protein [Catalinimonas niigatensis]WPP52324.1 DUF4252 domain-containing protein [Catalinimonas niigatensis]
MKKLIITIIAMQLLAFGVQAQNSAIASLFDKYADNEDFTKVSINSKMFDLFTEFEPDDPDTKEMANAISKLKGLKILAADSIGNAQKYYKEAKASIQKSNFEELMSIRDGKDDMIFMIQEEGGKISELLMLVGGDYKFVAMSLFGEIDLKQISKLSKGMKIDGMQYLENIDEKKESNK